MSGKRLWISGSCLWLMTVLAVSGVCAGLQPAKIVITPSSLSLDSSEQGRRVLVTGVTAGGEKFDLTREARFEPSGGVRVDDDG